ncbi:MAG TPA: hypothetical protein VF771_03510 [Longimicrobiaceae bacterium]
MPRRRRGRARQVPGSHEPLWPVLLGLTAVLAAIAFIAHGLVQRHNDELKELQRMMELYDRGDSTPPPPRPAGEAVP